MFKKSYFKYPFLYSTFFLTIILLGSFSNDFSNYSDISRKELYPIWLEYFEGLFITFSIVGIFLSIFNRNLKQIILFLVALRNTFFRKLINSLKTKVYKNFLFSDLIILIILCIGLFMGIASIFHYIQTLDVIGQRIFDRYYITKTTQTLFIIYSITSFLQIIRNTRFSNFSYLILILATVTQAFVDHSRFAVFPFLLISLALLFSDKDFQNVYKRNYIRVDSLFKIKKINIFKSTILILLSIILLNLFSSRFSKFSVFFNYFTSASFYGFGETIGDNVFTYQNLFFALTGIPQKLLNQFGIEYDLVRITVARPMTGILQLYSLHKSYFLSGALTALVLTLPLTLIRFISSPQIKFFCFLLLLTTTVTLPQYDLRASLRPLQILIIISMFSLEINNRNRIFKNGEKNTPT